MGSIYKITNTLNGKAYIGQTRHDAETGRIRHHLNGYGSQLLKQDVEKYGRDAFTFEILHDGIIPDFLDELEIGAIAEFNTIVPHGYNLIYGGRGGSHSEETKRKISEVQKGKSHSEETKRKISEARKGQTPWNKGRKGLQTPWNKGKKGVQISRNKGKPLLKETKRKISEALKGKSAWNKNPCYEEAHQFFCSFPSDMDLKQKRRLLLENFSDVASSSSIYAWIQKWNSELESKT